MIIKEALRDAAGLLCERETSVLEAEALLAFTLDVPKEYLIAHATEALEQEDYNVFKFYVGRLLKGEPMAYIMNSKEFFGLDFYVDNRVLIPRPETEFVVEKSLNYIRSADEDKRVRVLELGTGSGNISISLARAMMNEGSDALDEILALDISDDALEVARLNADQQSVDHLIHFVQSDLLESVDDGEEFDLIVANLPYIGEKIHRHLDDDVEKYEPALALFGGDNGLKLYERLFKGLDGRQIQFEFLVAEFGYGQSEDMAELAQEYFGDNWSIEKDLAGIDRFLIVSNN
jgi:release factor glutamine methyltransferase